jgi:hypothetical protein
MKTSELFRRARKLLESERGSKYICFCIEDCLDRSIAMARVVRASEIIKTRIYPHYTLEAWAFGKGLWHGDEVTEQDFREFRIRWLKALEEEFKAKGD